MSTMKSSSKSGKKDPGWDHGSLVNPERPNDGIKCNYCPKITKGGISRHKEHLAGGFRNATSCESVPEFIKTHMKQLLEAKKVHKASMDKVNYVDDDDTKEQEIYERYQEPRGVSAGKRPANSTFPSPHSAREFKKSKPTGPTNWYLERDVDGEKLKHHGSSKDPNYVKTKKKLRHQASSSRPNRFDNGFDIHHFEELLEAHRRYMDLHANYQYELARGIQRTLQMTPGFNHLAMPPIPDFSSFSQPHTQPPTDQHFPDPNNPGAST